MAAVGGDTVIPTNWSGMIVVAIVIGAVAAATYFGLHMQDEDAGAATQKDELSVQEVFSSSARREVAAAEPVRAIARADFASSVSATDDWDAPADDSLASSDDWDAPSSTADDYAEADESDWDNTTDSYTESGYDEYAEDESTSADSASTVDAKESSSTAMYTPAEAEPEVIHTRSRPSAEALLPWWQDAGDGLTIRFAGTLDQGNKVSDGIAIMFAEAVAPEQANQHITVKDRAGQTIRSNWKIGANPTLIYMSGLSEGRYTVTIHSGLSGESTQELVNTVSGPVFVY